MNRIFGVAPFVILGVCVLGSRADAGPLDPTQYASLGTLALSGNDYTIDSSLAAPTLSITGQSTPLFTGVMVNGVAVFDFSAISIASDATLMAISGLPIALLSRSGATIDGVVNVSAFANQGGPGAGGGGTGGTNQTVYPDPNDPTVSYSSGGGGGGFGGVGGKGSDLYGVPGGAGGDVGPSIASKLQGGGSGSGFYAGLGGAGGGVLELGAVSTITLLAGGQIDALGGDGTATGGGGGSGGGIFLHASSITLGGLLDVQGGIGDFGNTSGRNQYGASGAGGGGQIVVQTMPGQLSQDGDQIILSGGDINAGNGVFVTITVPEPSSLVLLGTAALGLIGHALARRRSPII